MLVVPFGIRLHSNCYIGLIMHVAKSLHEQVLFSIQYVICCLRIIRSCHALLSVQDASRPSHVCTESLILGCCSYVGTEDGKPFVFVSSIWDDQPRPLVAGDELFISYMANTPPLTAFLNLGFVPEELLAPALN